MPTRVTDGVLGLTSPYIINDESWLYRFQVPGGYDLLSLPHISYPIAILIVITDPNDDTEDQTFEVPTAGKFLLNATAVLTASKLEPENVVT